MELKLQNKLPASRIFNYVPTYFDNGVKYGVWHGGRAPLNGGGGKYIGQVARLDYDAFFGPYREEWHAASANGSQDADKLNWHGPFKTRMEASIFRRLLRCHYRDCRGIRKCLLGKCTQWLGEPVNCT
jgi:hypothetical protein